MMWGTQWRFEGLGASCAGVVFGLSVLWLLSLLLAKRDPIKAIVPLLLGLLMLPALHMPAAEYYGFGVFMAIVFGFYTVPLLLLILFAVVLWNRRPQDSSKSQSSKRNITFRLSDALAMVAAIGASPLVCELVGFSRHSPGTVFLLCGAILAPIFVYILRVLTDYEISSPALRCASLALLPFQPVAFVYVGYTTFVGVVDPAKLPAVNTLPFVALGCAGTFILYALGRARVKSVESSALAS
ncbi:MAG TPA: hypothetical protein VEJ63_10210 [Planctomycetota bacterium]|nr:hypothetical protein [Planctomycetota bacterium]